MLDSDLYKTDNLENTGNDVKVDRFPKTTEFLSGEGMDVCKELVEQVLNDEALKNDNIAENFEEFLNQASQRDKIKCKKNLKNCKTFDDVASLIFEKIGYRVGSIAVDENLGLIIEQDRAIAEQDRVIAEQDRVIAEQDRALIEGQQEMDESIITMKKAIEERDKLIDKYSDKNFAENTNENSENYRVVKEQLENNGILNQLRESDRDEQFINNYILVQATLVELRSNPTIYEESDISFFDRVVKNLDNACNIPDTSLSSFSNQNLSQTRKELFHESIGNKGLIEQRENNIEKHNSAYENLFRIENDDESIIFNQKEVQDKTKDMVEELCMTSQIKGFLSCIPDNYSENFQFNKANEINVQDGILQLDGHVNGVNFSLRQDTNDVNARLQTSTMLFRDKDDNLDFTGKYKNSPFVLPTATQVFDTAIAAIDKDKLSKIQDQDDYFDTLEKMVLESMNKLYENTKYTHHYLEGEIKSEEVINKTMGIYRQIGGGNIESLSKVTNEKLYNFFDTVEFNLNVMTNKEKQRLLNCMTNLFGKIVEGGDVAGSDQFVKDENLAKFLGSKSQTEKEIKGLGGLEDSKSFFNLFDDFYINTDERNESGNRKIINLSKLIECLDDSQYAQSFWEDINGTNADDWLDQELQMA